MKRLQKCLPLCALLLATLTSHAQVGERVVGGVQPEAKILKRYDKDGDGALDAAERLAAMQDFGFDLTKAAQRPATAARRLSPNQVRKYSTEPLFDEGVVRTIFLSFDTPTWESELAVFKDSDVQVPAMAVIDGRMLRDVGIRFRGEPSYRNSSTGNKRSFDITLNFRHRDQSFLGATRLTLLGTASDPSFLRTVLFMHIARQYYPAPGANFMRVVINGEDWGIYVNQQALDPAFTAQAGAGRGPIWTVPASTGARGGLEYWGEDLTPYQQVFELAHDGGRSRAQAWQSLIHLCQVLNETPPERLPAALAPLMDVDGTLRFLAVDNALMNHESYYQRGAFYGMYADERGRFHFVAHHATEALRPMAADRSRREDAKPSRLDITPMGLDPLAGADHPQRPLLSRLLAVPEYRQRYLGYIRDINSKWLNWERFSALVLQERALIADDVRRDEHKLFSTEAFESSLIRNPSSKRDELGSANVSLKKFVEQRHDFLAQTLGEK
jgi:hypothetical protein